MSPTQMETAESILDNIGKLKVADHARLLADNQSTLDRSNRSDESHRDYTRRVREAQAKQVFGENWEPAIPQKAGDDPMQIFIDSPVTISRPDSTPTPAATPTQQAPTQQPPTPPSLAAKTLPWILAAAAALGGAGLTSALIDRSPAIEAPAAEPVEFPFYDVEKWVPK